MRDHKARIRKKILYDLNNDKLEGSKNDGVLFGKLIAWARNQKKWQKSFDAFPAIINASGKAILSMHASGTGRVIPVLPTTLDECHTVILKLTQEINEKNAEIREKNVEVNRLRKFEEKDRSTRQKRSMAGKKGGRPKGR